MHWDKTCWLARREWPASPVQGSHHILPQGGYTQAGCQPMPKLFAQTSYRTSCRLLVICPRATAIESTDSVAILPTSGSPTRSPMQPVRPADVLSVHGT